MKHKSLVKHKLLSTRESNKEHGNEMTKNNVQLKWVNIKL